MCHFDRNVIPIMGFLGVFLTFYIGKYLLKDRGMFFKSIFEYRQPMNDCDTPVIITVAIAFLYPRKFTR